MSKRLLTQDCIENNLFDENLLSLWKNGANRVAIICNNIIYSHGLEISFAIIWINVYSSQIRVLLNKMYASVYIYKNVFFSMNHYANNNSTKHIVSKAHSV